MESSERRLRFGLFAGNSNGDNIITVLDYNAVGSQMFQSGYLPGDHDLNGIITVLDYNPVGRNIFIATKVSWSRQVITGNIPPNSSCLTFFLEVEIM